ncbi:kinesin-like protein KIN-14Q isoform X4 [Corylus avellana]|uniref:kinesin-like protein KIN-14Q isoform X4 n=1 Tax=Corylus avellana TaxID=13451 RepID=UPI00286ADF49|nr:kinesin-like protein KIN-14Q isoform X4 [Corylus avellana]
MEDNQWHDPLLLTDVSWQQDSSNSHSHHNCPPSPSSQTSTMADPDAYLGRSMLGFSLTSPDLVICAGSPDLSGVSNGDFPQFLENKFHQNIGSSVELSLENGINGSEIEDTQKTPAVKFSTSLCQNFREEFSPEASFELYPPLRAEDRLLVLSINAGSKDGAVTLGQINFLEDSCFDGGDTVRTDAICPLLYQSARFGNFSYNFRSVGSGGYVVDLHFAEIVFTEGPPGMRVFDVYIQEKKVVSCLDIYARVGGNEPLVVSGLNTFVDDEKGLSIRFEGVIGSPILCGISIRRDFPANSREVELPKVTAASQLAEREPPKDNGNFNVEGDHQKVLRDFECQKMELAETRRMLEELKRENQVKSRECQEAWKSLQELQNELMRKSMHVGSLAFAVEGQVKEKSKWFSSLRDLTRKLKIMKMEHIKLADEARTYKKCLADMDEMRATVHSAINQQAHLHEGLKIKFIEGAKERKEIYNKMLELKGNIRVFCRCRPLNTEEIAAGAGMAIDFESAKDGELTVRLNGAPRKTFKFDAVFGHQATQADVFQDTAPFVTSVLDGFNVCIFAYGQTGTGKTFTMEGTEEARGVNFRTLKQLFSIIRERQKLYRYDVSVSVLEVYNEQIRDLLVSGAQPGVAAKRLEIRQVGEGIHHVPGLVEAHVNSMTEVWEVLQTGSNARVVGSTNANEHSSRSHCIHCVMVKGENLLNGECTRSKLWLVDLAGSERVTKTEVQGERLKETQNINRSLSALGDVISALATKSAHIPFRNSKLTHLLQDSLGGDSKALMFVQISPNENDLSETLCSLNFASRVRGIELGPAKRQLDPSELLKYKQMVERTKQDAKSKDVHIKKMEETIQGLDLKIKERDLKTKYLQDKVKELESQLLIERKLARQHVDTKIAEQQQQQQMKHQQEEQNTAPMRPPLANRPLASYKNLNDPVSSTLGKDQVNLTRPFSENNSSNLSIPLHPTEGFSRYIDPTEKENNIGMAEQPLLQKRTGRASICTMAKRIPAAPAPRRSSLIPFPSTPSSTLLPSSLLPFPPYQADKKEDTNGFEANCLPEQTPCDSPKRTKIGSNKKLSSILRQSLQRKMQIKSPMQQHMRKGGINVGLEKVRVSIGSRGKMGHRVFHQGNNKRTGMKESQQKQIRKEKERGWNIGNVGRAII